MASGTTRTPKPAVRIAIAIAGTLLASGAILAIGFAGAMQYALPATVLQFAPWDSVALERASEDLLEANASPQTVARAAGLARRAISRDPTSVTALRTLALAVERQGDGSRASQLMRHASRLSRRDLGVELWLIEEAVAADDVPRALAHYDNALRTQPTAAAVLFPILAGGLSDVRLVEPIARTLAGKPAWSRAFMTAAAQHDAVDVNFARLSMRMLDLGVRPHNDVLTVALDRMVARGRFDVAWAFYRHAFPQASPALRDGDFGGVDRSIPFEWSFAREANISAGLGDGTLDYSVDIAKSGRLAWQTLRLAPGSYRLSAQFGAVEGPLPKWRLLCPAPYAGTIGIRTDKPGSVDFRVGPDCPFQRLELVVGDTAPETRMTGSVDNVAIAPIAGDAAKPTAGTARAD